MRPIPLTDEDKSSLIAFVLSPAFRKVAHNIIHSATKPNGVENQPHSTVFKAGQNVGVSDTFTLLEDVATKMQETLNIAQLTAEAPPQEAARIVDPSAPTLTKDGIY